MATENDDPKVKEKKDPKLEIRDLKPKKDVKGGARNGGSGEKRPPGSSGEIDFMNWD
jgi:hypothetical protein